jgi:hypothetical protein
MLVGYQVTQLIYVAAKLGLADALASGPKTSDELSLAVTADSRVLGRILRALDCVGVVECASDNRFRLTSVGHYLRADVPGSLRAIAIFHGESWVQRAWGGLLGTAQTGGIAFDAAHSMPFSDYVAQHPEVSRGLDERAAGNTARVADSIAASYGFSGCRRLVDVGGGYGTLAAAIVRRNPHLTAIVSDRASVEAAALAYLARVEGGERCSFVSIDFFESVPSGGDVYLLKSVIHDWDDQQGRAILRNVRQAISSGGRLLLVERVMPSQSDPSFELAMYDIMMMVLSNGHERSEGEYRALLGTAGFQMNRVIETPTAFSLVEASPD